MDDLPEGMRIVTVNRNNLFVLDKYALEPKTDPKRWAAMEAAILESVDNRRNPETKSEDNFVRMGNNILKNAALFSCTYHDAQEPLAWKIYGETEYITQDTKYTKIKDHSRPAKLTNIDFEHTDPHENFFKHVWPDMKGSAALVDEFLSDNRAVNYNTYKQRRMKFHDEEHADPDWKTKQCVLALIAAAAEINNGMDCWKSGKGLGRKPHPDFGQWVSKDHEMQCFMSCAAFIWANKKWWMLTGTLSCQQSTSGTSRGQKRVFPGS
jgi:hypothetical protein